MLVPKKDFKPSGKRKSTLEFARKRLIGAENGFFQKWAGYQASVNAQKVKSDKMNGILGTIPAFFSTLANYAVMVMGIWFVMNGRLTLGALQMFQGFLGSFMVPAMTFVTAGQTIQEMRTDMERVEDVMQ